MTSNAKMMLQGLVSLAVVAASAGAHAQNLETPGTPAAEAAAAPAASGPSGFGDGGQFVLSIENLFGYNWEHESQGNATGSSQTYSVLGNAGGAGAYPYDWPRLGFDYFVTKSISAGAAVAFTRNTSGNASTNAFEVAPRLGYGMVLGPLLAVWPRVGLTYVNATNLSYGAISLDLTAVILASQHLVVTVAPVVNIGIFGSSGSGASALATKFTTLGAQFGLALPF
ncbi:MAG TPA: hypothetical protein VKZ18_05780 [Polyangia bacterium]|nr:hypothetical protein [Polyangia bacterium]